MKILSKIYLVLLFSLTAVACDNDRNKPGYSYFPDMEQSRSYETYSENPVLEGGVTNLMPVENTVPRGQIPYEFEKTDENRKLAGQVLHNPYIGTAMQGDAVIEGKRLYNIYCWHCHGDKGDGKGFLYTSGKYGYPPASLLADKVAGNPDGEIFHVISVGFGVMGAHQGQILPDDRWKIATYVREVLINGEGELAE
ncbi:c-type cytochrome [Saccharicrinis fermentans]|uniref:Putative bifunctional cbb3-type cytochrome c oxidase subunit II/cytochrome c n=1 Tax=Saccharicrinis fermentans DSM 9555 = JCM 21142 TaxID=869213 RepID=W7XUH7_9BACT|nr:cytochrome c [Saccharicrinis fermentans]GAF01655.1 putative bifunctional cbb3-type cytochrome c oxidase subunit II/cytochrome c [Saccharicrinis fermentans DSM 9555 = JCM 21142]